MEEAREIFLDHVCRIIRAHINGEVKIGYDLKGRMFIEVGTFDKFLRWGYRIENLDEKIVRGKTARDEANEIIKDFKEKVLYYTNQKYFS